MTEDKVRAEAETKTKTQSDRNQYHTSTTYWYLFPPVSERTTRVKPLFEMKKCSTNPDKLESNIHVSV